MCITQITLDDAGFLYIERCGSSIEDDDIVVIIYLIYMGIHYYN